MTTPQEQPDGHTKGLVHSGPQEACVPTEQADKPVVHIEGIGGNCPVQAKGTINGAPFYFRARGEHWSIEVGGGYVLEDSEKGIPGHGFLMEREYGDGPYDAGWMPVEEARAFIDLAAAEYVKWSGDADPSTAGKSPLEGDLNQEAQS